MTPTLNTGTLAGPWYPPTWPQATALCRPGDTLWLWDGSTLVQLQEEADWTHYHPLLGHMECYVAEAGR